MTIDKLTSIMGGKKLLSGARCGLQKASADLARFPKTALPPPVFTRSNPLGAWFWGRAQGLALSLGLLALPSPCLHAQTATGPALIDRANNDSSPGQVYLLGTPQGIVGKAVTFSFYDNESGNRTLTPLIFERMSATQYLLRGVGTSRATTGAGLQAYPFDLIAGADGMGSNHTFGFTDRAVTYPGSGTAITTAASSTGSADWDSSVATQGPWFFTPSLSFSLAVGQEFSAGGGGVGTVPYNLDPRTYSAQLAINRPPSGNTLSNSSIAENNSGGGNLIGSFAVQDPESEAWSVALVAGTGDTDNGVFTIFGSQLFINVTTDHETKNNYSCRVRATDAKGQT